MCVKDQFQQLDKMLWLNWSIYVHKVSRLRCFPNSPEPKNVVLHMF